MTTRGTNLDPFRLPPPASRSHLAFCFLNVEASPLAHNSALLQPDCLSLRTHTPSCHLSSRYHGRPSPRSRLLFSFSFGTRPRLFPSFNRVSTRPSPDILSLPSP